MADSRTGQEIYKIRPKASVEPQNKDVIKKKYGCMSKEHTSQMIEHLMVKAGIISGIK